jgi:outer membrane lipoprotein-sorting protein
MKTSQVFPAVIVLFVAVLCAAQGTTPAPVPSPAAPSAGHDPAAKPAAENASTSGELKAVLAKMNASAENFKSAQADFEFETYQKVVDEKDIQKGHIYFRRKGKDVEAAFNITSPAPKQVVYREGKLSMYEPRIDQVTERDVTKNKSAVEAFLSLGFGARGDDMLKSYDVTLAGWEAVEGVRTAKLELVPKDQKMRQTYNKIILWLDPERDVSLQQQFLEPSEDYRRARYTNMKLNGKLPDDVFRLKTTASTKVIKSQ